ncbi:hypothetical protein CH273_10900 [Rhodococcus sp. 05-339-2]|nr:hypothetical protein CH273_10900 [Rhodococcus sp. 05-339-2]
MAGFELELHGRLARVRLVDNEVAANARAFARRAQVRRRFREHSANAHAFAADREKLGHPSERARVCGEL